jgi:hypothetical protein
MTLAGLHAHGSVGTFRKALELDRRECGFGHEKGQTDKREKKREWSHGPFPLLNSFAALNGLASEVAASARCRPLMHIKA